MSLVIYLQAVTWFYIVAPNYCYANTHKYMCVQLCTCHFRLNAEEYPVHVWIPVSSSDADALSYQGTATLPPLSEFSETWEACFSEWAYFPSRSAYGRIATATKADRIESARHRFEVSARDHSGIGFCRFVQSMYVERFGIGKRCRVRGMQGCPMDHRGALRLPLCLKRC